MQIFNNRHFIIASVFLPVAAFSMAAFSANFKPGDRVEAKKMGDWKPGVVLGIDKNFGSIEIQFDDDNSLPTRMPPEVRKRFLKKSVDPQDVRPLANAAPEKPAAAMPTRTWKDRTGKFNIEARFQGLRDGKAILENSKGKRIEVPLEKLSEEDAKYIQDQKANDEDNPFEAASGDANNPSTASTSGAKMLKANRKGVKNVQPKSLAAWTFKPEAKPATIHSKLQNEHVDLMDIPGSDKFFENVLDLYASDDGTRLLVAREEGKVGGDKGVFLQEVNLLDQQAGKLVAMPPTTKILDAWTGDHLVAYRPNFFGSGSNGVLTIAKLEGSQLTPIVSWNPYDNEDWKPKYDIEEAWFLPNRRIMTVNSHGEAFTIWNFDEAKAQFVIPVKSASNVQSSLSADRQWLAIAMPERIAIIDLSEGTHVAMLSVKPNTDYKNMAFSDDNQKLMAVSESGISRWDLTTGKLIGEFWHPNVSEHSKARWAGDFIFMGDQYLFDPDRRILLW
jgi:hypothetical protein